MKVEQAKQIASKAIEQLSQALERGHSETLTACYVFLNIETRM